MTEPVRSDRILRVSMRIAVALLGSGAQTDDVEAAVTSVAAAFDLHDVQASVTFSTIALSHDPDGEARPTTLLHIVRDRTADFARLTKASELVQSIRDGELDIDAAEAALDRLEVQPSPYGAVVNFIAPGLSAFGSTIVFGGNLLEAVTTLVIAFAVQPLLSRVERSTIPPFFQLVVGAAASTVLVGLAVAIGLPIAGGLVLTGSLLRFLPGYALVSGFRDLIDQSMISGTARLAEALLLGAGVAGGTALGLAIVSTFDVYLTIETVGRTDWGTAVAGLAALIAVGAFAVRLGVPPRAMVEAAILGAAAWLAFIAVSDLGGRVDPALATFGAAVIIGVVGRVLARRSEAPAALWVVPAILPLLPGLQIVQAMLAATEAARVSGLVGAISTAFFIGTGVASGDLIVQLIRRVRDHVVAPAVGAVAGGVEVYIVAPVERVVDRARSDAGSDGDDRPG